MNMLTALAPAAADPALPATRLRVVSIAHTMVSRSAGRLRYQPLQAYDDIETHLVVPARWREFGRWLDADPPDDPGVEMHVRRVRWCRAGPASWYLHHYPRLGRLLAQLRPEVVHLWEEPWSLVALQAALLRRRRLPDAALVLEVDQNLHKRLPPPFEAIRRRVLRETDLVLARSAEAERVVRACGYDGPSMLIGYGVDQARFRPMDRAAARSEFGLSGFVIGYVGRLVEEKGLDDALDAVSHCRASGVMVTLAILGEGPHAAALQARAAALGLAGQVQFLPWAAPEQVASFLNALDALILITRTTRDVREQFGRVIIEAHSCGVPVIGSSSGAIPDVVGAGGWIVPERDPVRLAALLTTLSAQPEQLAAAGAAGQRKVAECYTFPVVAARLREAWRTAHQQRRVARSSRVAHERI